MKKIILKNCSDCGSKVFTYEDRSLCKGCEEKKRLEEVFPEWNGNIKNLPENFLLIIYLVDEMRKEAEQVKNDLRELIESGTTVSVTIQDACGLRHDNLLKGTEEKMANFYRYELKKFLCNEKNKETMILIKNLSLVKRFPTILKDVEELLGYDCRHVLVIAKNTEQAIDIKAIDVSFGKEQVGRVQIKIGVINRVEKESDLPVNSGRYLTVLIDGADGTGSFNDFLSTHKVDKILLKLKLKSYKELASRKVYYKQRGMGGELLEIV